MSSKELTPFVWLQRVGAGPAERWGLFQLEIFEMGWLRRCEFLVRGGIQEEADESVAGMLQADESL